MRDPAKNIKKAYFDRIDKLKYAGKEIRMYDGVDMNAEYPYIYFVDCTAITGTPESKCGRGYMVSVHLAIVTAFEGNSGGFYDAESISQELTQLIGVDYIKPDNFQVITTTLEAAFNRAEQYQGGMLYKRFITFSHQTSEK